MEPSRTNTLLGTPSPQLNSWKFLDRENYTSSSLLGDPETRQGPAGLAGRKAPLAKDLGIELNRADHITTGTGRSNSALGKSTLVIAEASGDEVNDNEYVGDEKPIQFENFEHTPPPGDAEGISQEFNGDCGRTDFQEGSSETLYKSVNSQLLQDQISLKPWEMLDKAATTVLTPYRVTAHPFLIKDYDDIMASRGRLPLGYPDSTMGLTLVSGPDILESLVLPLAKREPLKVLEHGDRDPLERATTLLFKLFAEELGRKDLETVSITNFEMITTSVARVHCQIAAHVSGCATYFTNANLRDPAPSWFREGMLSGCAIHPVHGGYFSILGVIVLKNFCPEILPQTPSNLFAGIDDTLIEKLLREFGTNSTEGKWRDVLPRTGTQRHSEHFRCYLRTPKPDRLKFLLATFLTLNERAN